MLPKEMLRWTGTKSAKACSLFGAQIIPVRGLKFPVLTE
jgi:hypothetical protein